LYGSLHSNTLGTGVFAMQVLSRCFVALCPPLKGREFVGRTDYAKLPTGGRDGKGEGMALVKACKTSDLKPGGAIRVNHKPPIAVYRLNDGFYATDDTCTHAEASLAAGDVDLEECAVECPYHGSFFDIKTGHVLSLPASRPLKTYPVKIVDDEVFVEVG